MSIISSFSAYVPHPGWLPYLKMVFGFFLLAILAGLAGIIALGKIHADSSYGLDIILGGLLTLSGGFVGWAFREGKSKDEERAGTIGAPAEPE